MHHRTVQSRQVFCLVRLQQGKLKSPSTQSGALFSVWNLGPKLVDCSSLSVPVSLSGGRDEGMDGIFPGQEHQMS